MLNNYDDLELKQFDLLASQWWETCGPLQTLHQFNPLRLSFIRDHLLTHSFRGQSILDVGCGGGILSEAMAAEGAMVTGIDKNQSLIDVAIMHHATSNIALNLQYHCLDAEQMAKEKPHAYDIVTCFELLEHVPSPQSVVLACATLLKPGGYVFFSTINRCLKSYLFAILGAEILFKCLPKHTHDYAKLIKPSELSTWMRAAELFPRKTQGVGYNPWRKQFFYTSDLSVNYFFYAQLV